MSAFYKKKSKKYDSSNRSRFKFKKIVTVETEAKTKPLTHTYMTAHFISFAQELQSNLVGFN